MAIDPCIQNMPLKNFNILHCNDVDMIRQKLSVNYHPLYCDLVGRERRFQMIYNHAFLNDISFSASSVVGNFQFESEPTDSAFILQMYMLRGGCEISHGRSTVQVDEKGGGSIVSPFEKNRWTYRAGQVQVAVRLERKPLEAYLQALIGEELKEPLQFHHRVDTREPRIQGVKEMISFYIHNLDHDSSLLKFPVMDEKMRSLFFNSLLHAQPHNYFHVLELMARPAAPEFVKCVEEYIDAHIDQPVRVNEIAQRCGIGIRSLQAGFRKYRHKTLCAFIKERRLLLARKLLAEDPKLTVTKVAYQCGFNNLGHFAAEYKKKYGFSPSETYPI